MYACFESGWDSEISETTKLICMQFIVTICHQTAEELLFKFRKTIWPVVKLTVLITFFKISKNNIAIFELTYLKLLNNTKWIYVHTSQQFTVHVNYGRKIRYKLSLNYKSISLTQKQINNTDDRYSKKKFWNGTFKMYLKQIIKRKISQQTETFRGRTSDVVRPNSLTHSVGHELNQNGRNNVSFKKTWLIKALIIVVLLVTLPVEELTSE